MGFKIVPNPFNGCPGIGFWEGLIADLRTASELLEANTDSADPSSSSSSDAEYAFDPDVATVTDLIAGAQEVIDALRDTE